MAAAATPTVNQPAAQPATPAVPALLSLDEYLHTPYRPDCDFVDGQLEERNMGEYEHSTIQIALGAWFFNHRAEWKIRVASEYRTLVADSRIRIPDLSVFPQDGTPEKIRVTPPLIAIEILSPEDRINRVVLRLEDFRKMGIPNIWLLDPMERVAFTYSDHGLKLADTPRLTLPHSPIFVDLPELFAALD